MEQDISSQKNLKTDKYIEFGINFISQNNPDQSNMDIYMVNETQYTCYLNLLEENSYFDFFG
jgi:hypothetical protein